MQTIASSIHPSITDVSNKTIFTRKSARAIVLKEQQILLLYTGRYDDYSLPGGGVDDGESIEQGLIRELAEETGANNIKVEKEFGLYEEIRPWNRHGYELVHMLSYCYVCSIGDQLDAPKLEDYEHANGMKPVWISLDEAIKHNQQTFSDSDKAGLSLQREITLLKKIKQELA
ncbi:NUDIX hydrolase [Paraferrimonas sp. SM1919]|uniref:NUDIX hydrolase n=1 Tax=Paraferrimonas sp. SM1919 TaxID=2662263 RepID=UPI0013D7B666|nr:NUDIX domain-containing protein [Paraferrimonas sp. SM1919]